MDKVAFIKENNTNLIKTTLNDLKYIKSIVIFTAEESNSLTNLLENAGYAFVPVTGEYNGNQDNLYAVFNLSLNSALYLCRHCQLTSLVWNRLNSDGSIYSRYWELNDSSAPYHKKENGFIAKQEWTTQYNADDDFAITGENVKYSIPFSVLKSLNDKIGKNLKQIVEQEKARGVTTINEDNLLDFAMNRTGLSSHLYRKAIYNNISQSLYHEQN